MNEHKPRRYGQWGGNPAGWAEVATNCVEGVMPTTGFPIEHQCYRKRGHGPDGLYCKQHAKRFANAKGLEL